MSGKINKPVNAENIILLLWEKAKENLTEAELQWLEDINTTTEAELANLSQNLKNIGSLISSSDHSSPFDDKANVASLLWSAAHQIEVLNGLTFVSGEANYRLENPDDYPPKQAVNTKPSSIKKPA